MSYNIKNFFKNYRRLILIFVLILTFSYIINIPFKLSIFLFLSIVLITFFPKKLKVLYILFSTIIGLINIVLITFALIPQPKDNIDINEFFLNQHNYIKIYKNDDNTYLKKNLATLRIKRGNKIFTYRLWKTPNLKKIEVFENDLIFFESRTKKLKTFINLYLWDGTIIRILPQTYLNLTKILINNQNLLESQTKISLIKGNIRFRVIRSIFNDNNFNIETPHGTIIIRGTAGILGVKKEKSLIYSYDHLIELITKSGKKQYITKNEIAIFNDNNIIAITKNINILKNFINNNVENLIRQFNFLDKKDIEEFKEKFRDWINKKIDIINKTNILGKVTYYKLKILSIFSEKYKYDLEKYYLINLFLGKKYDLKNENLIKKAIFIPLNKNFEALKNKYIQQKANLNIEYMKNYIYIKINELLEKNNTATEEIKKLIEKLKNL